MIGIGQHSYSPDTWKPNSGAKFHDALTFLEYAHSIGAGGVQAAIARDERPRASKIRARCEELGAYFEGNLSVPKTDAEIDEFESHIRAIKEAGGTVARTACLSGRRYETFKTLADFKEFKAASVQSLIRAAPIVRKHKIKLAVENHKDWFAQEHVAILRDLSSEWIGATIDTGNNIALLENPYQVIETLAPFAVSSHLKDIGVAEYDDGFLMNEVPLGAGFLDVRRIVAMLRKANPPIHLNLEMMTRDALKIPCVTQAYYATFENTNAARLAETLATVKGRTCSNLPRVAGLTPEQRIQLEDDNVRKSIDWARQNAI